MTDDDDTPVPEALRPRVLIVDDDEGYTEFWRDHLPKEHAARVDLHWVVDLDEAFRELYRRDDYYHMVLLDLGLPPYWGIETYREFRSKIPDIPVIVLTGTQDMELDAQLRREGAVRTLWKDGVTGTGIVKAIFDVRLEQRHSANMRADVARTTRSAEDASIEYLKAVQDSVPPHQQELCMANAHVANSEAVGALSRLLVDSAEALGSMREQLSSLAVTVNRMCDHSSRLAVLEEKSRTQHDSLVDFKEDFKEVKVSARREWLSKHRSELIAFVVVSIIAAVIGVITKTPVQLPKLPQAPIGAPE